MAAEWRPWKRYRAWNSETRRVEWWNEEIKTAANGVTVTASREWWEPCDGS